MPKCMSKMLIIAAFAGLLGCSGGSNGSPSPNFSGSTDTPLTIKNEGELIGGPTAQGRVGDILLKNDKIRVIIQKPRKNSGINSFGGNIIDADIVRSDGGSGEDNFGSIFPLINIEWTVNYYNLEVVADGKDGGPKVVRVHGVIDVYDYLDLDFITEVAEGLVGQRISFSNRFDDRKNPFAIYEDMKGLSQEVTTDYTLEPGMNVVRIDTTLTNNGSEDVKLPIGQFINGSGEVSMLVPGIGFTPDLMAQASNNTPALIYSAFDGSDVSYGFFYKSGQFMNPEIKEAYTTTSISYSGVTGLLLGEEFLKLAPLGSGGVPDIHFSIPAGQKRTVTGYFVVGTGSAGTVLDAGLAAIGAATRRVSGIVEDSNKKPAAGATVAVLHKGQTLITYRTDSSGRFFGDLPSGGDSESKRFGNGRYTIVADMAGHHQNTTQDASKCDPSEINLVTRELVEVKCVLGDSGKIVLAGPVIDSETKTAIPVRLTIVGEDPSPNKIGSAGRFRSTYEWDPPFGIYDVKYITAKGTFDLTNKNSFHLEPGNYLFVISHGPEYTSDERMVEVAAGKTVTIDGVKLSRAVKTPGYISADFHVHGINSADSSLKNEMRVLSAAAEGLDVLQSSDHDFVTDYGPHFENLVQDGSLLAGTIKTSAGDEITPNHYGHIHVFPLIPDNDDPEGGAFDWSNSEKEEMSPAPDYDWTLDEMIEKLRAMPGSEVIMVNHIMDNPTGLPTASGWVTTTFYREGFGVEPLSTYADPVERRMSPASGSNFPLPFGTSGLMTINYDVVEIAIGQQTYNNGLLFRSAIPTWFNLLNLGQIVTAAADADTHRIVAEPVGIPRNFIASSVDPRDARGADYSEIDLEEYAASIKAHRLTISAGPVVMMSARSETGDAAEIGQIITGRKVLFTVEVKAPPWGWFDTVDIYANTEPIPVDDKTDTPMQGTAADPAMFYKPYHVPRYTYEPTKTFKLSDATLENWKAEKGAISATVSFEMNVEDDTWVVAMAYGTRQTKGYRSLFPIATKVLSDPADMPENFDPTNLSEFHADKKVGGAAWGLTNPIFIDADGGGFTAKYVREGISPIK